MKQKSRAVRHRAAHRLSGPADQSEDVADDLPGAEDSDGFESDGVEDASLFDGSLLAEESDLADESEAGLPLTADSGELEVSDAVERERA